LLHFFRNEFSTFAYLAVRLSLPLTTIICVILLIIYLERNVERNKKAG